MKSIYCDGGCNKQSGEFGFGSVVNELREDLVNLYSFLFPDMQLREVSLPIGKRTVIIAKFSDVKSQQNNGAELMALVAALRIALQDNIYTIYCDSDLLIKYWSLNLKKNKRLVMDPNKVKYIDELISLRVEFNKRKGNIIKISGGDNLADLGYHHH